MGDVSYLKQLGNRGECAVVTMLEKKGFTLIAKNWFAGRIGELDVIAYHEATHTLVCAEVKTRRQNISSSYEGCTKLKQRRMRQVIEAFLYQHPEYATARILPCWMTVQPDSTLTTANIKSFVLDNLAEAA
jgi:Holliday junction resolvase-like predicted endonuclease